MGFPLFRDLMKSIKAYVVPPRQGWTGDDYIKDPFQGERIITSQDPAGLLPSSDGNLYAPLKDGFQRTKSSVVIQESIPIISSSDNATPHWLISSTYRVDGTEQYIVGIYQDSGGALDFSVCYGATAIYTQTGVASGTWTAFDLPTVAWGGGCQVKWSAPAGAGQLVYGVYKYLSQIDDV